GKQIQVALTASPIRDAKGAMIGTATIIRDITERKVLEKQFYTAQRMDAIGRLAGGVAHDFNNLLSVINGYCSFILRKLSAEHQIRKYVEEIGKAGDRAASLTRQLLAFSRKQRTAPIVFDMNTLINDMEKMLHRLIGEDIIMKIKSDGLNHTVNADI